MAANNDYFVKFDSNAVAWAKQLETQLQPARNVINGMLASLNQIDSKSAVVGNKLGRALMAANPQAQHVATGGQPKSVAQDAVNSALNRQADAVDDLTTSLRVVVEGMRAANAAIAAVPGKIQRSMASISTSLANMRGAHLEGKGRDQGAFISGTPEQAVRNAVRNAVRGGDIDLTGRAGIRPVPSAPTGIASVRRSDIDRANFDRVIDAIRVQTQTLATGFRLQPHLAGPPATDVAPGRRPTRGAAAKKTPVDADEMVNATEAEVAEAAARLNAIDQKIARVIAALGDSADAATNKLVADLQEERSKLAAVARKTEREATGITQAEQKKRAQAEAEAVRPPPITDVERAENLRKQALLAAPSAADFESRATGRPKKGDYTRQDLDEMADLYNQFGVAVRNTTRTTKDELAKLLREASIRVRELFPGGVPAELATKGRQVQKTTKISPETAAMLGDLNDAVATRAAAREIIAADRRSGGQRAPKSGPTLGGEVYGASPTGTRGRREFGAAIFDPSAPTPLTRAANQADVLKAYAAIAPQIEAAIPRAVKLARDPAFNPYDPKHNVQIGRGTPGEENLGFAAAGRLRDIRKATAALDEMGEEFELLTRALRKNESFVDRATDRLERGIANPEGRDDREEIRLAQQRIQEKRARLAELEAVGGDLFRDPSYQRGRRERTIAEGPVTATGEKPLSPAELYKALASGEMRGARDISDARLMQQARAETFGGLRTAMGSRDLMKMIPGLNINQRTGRFTSQDGLDQGTQARLDKAVQKFEAAERFTTRQRAGGDPAKIADAESKLQVAANRLANVVEGAFRGISPTVKELTGITPTDPGVQADEARRVQARRDAEAERTRRFKDTPERAQEKLAQEITRHQKNLAEAIERRAALQAQMAATEAKIGRNLTATQKQHALGKYSKAASEVETLTAQEERLKRLRRMTQDPANYDLPITKDDFGHAAGPKRRYDTNLYDARLGYGPPIEDELARTTKAREEAERRRQQAQQGLGGVGELRTQVREMDAVEREIEQLNAALAKAQAATEKAAKATDRKTAADARAAKVVGDANGDLVAKRRQQEALKAEGPWTRRDIKALGGDAEAVSAARTRRQQINDLGREIGDLKKAAGGGAGGRPPGGRTAAGGDFGDDDSILRQILAAIKDTNSILRKGVPTRGKVDEAGRTPARAAAAQSATPAQVAAAGGSDAEMRAAMDEQRQVAERRRLAEEARKVRQAEQQRRDTGALTRADQQRTAEMREQARQAQKLADALDLVAGSGTGVSAAANNEISVLRRLTKELNNAQSEEEQLAAARRVAAQQTKVASVLDRGLERQGIQSAGRRDAIRTVLSDAGPPVETREFESIMRSSRAAAGFRATGQGFGEDMGTGALDGFARTFGGNTSFWSRIMHTTGTFIVRNFAAGAVFGLTNVMQEILTQALAAEATFVRVSDALQATNKESGSLRANLAQMSSEYGVALNDTYTTAASLTGLFSNVDDLAAATKISTQLQTISNGALNADEAVGVLASTMSAFGLEGVEGAERIADVFTTIQNNLGVNLENTAEGVAAMAGLAKQMNLSFEQASVFVAAIAKQTNQTGAGAGEQFSRILASLQSGRSQNVIRENFGVDVSQLLDEGEYGDALKGMMAGWNDLTTEQQNNVAVTVAGQRQMRAFQGLMNGASKALQTLTKAENSQGEAAERMEEILKNVQSRLRQLGTTFQAIVDNLLQMGLLNFLGVVLVLTTNVLQIINSILSTVNKFADSNGFTSFLRDIAGFAIGAIVALKLLGAATRGISGVLDARRARVALDDELGGGRSGVGAAGIAGRRATLAAGAPVPGAREPGPIARRGFIVGGTQALLAPLANASLNGAKIIGNWAANFQPQGRFSAPLHAFGERMRRESAARLQSLERTRNLVNQPRPAGLFGTDPLATTAGGATRGQRVQQRAQAGVNRGMAVFGRTAQVAAAAGNKVAGSMGKLGLAGLGLDAALLILGAGIVRLSQNAQRSSRLTRVAEEAFQNLYNPEQASLEDAKVDPKSADYVGEAFAAWQQELKEMQDQDTGFNRTMGGIGLLAKNFGQAVTLGFNGWTSVGEQLDQELGQINGAPAGSAETLDLQNALLRQIPTIMTPEEADRVRNDALSELEEMANDVISNDDLSGAQKAAWLAEIEEADKWIREQIGSRSAVIEGLAAGNQLNSEEINKLLATVQTFSTVGQSGIITTLSTQGGLNVSEYLRSRLEATGLAPDSPLRKKFEEMLTPDADVLAEYGLAGDLTRYVPTGDTPEDLLKRLTGGATAVDLGRLGVGTSRHAYVQATRNLRDLKETNIADDDERVVQATADVEATFNAWMQSLDGLVQTIYSEADTWSTLQTNEGDYRGAIRTQAQAIEAAERVFRNANRETIQLIRNAAEVPNKIRKRARELEKGIGKELRPNNLLDQSALRFNEDDAYRQQLLDPVRQLREQFQRTSAWRQNASRQIARVHSLIQTVIMEATADFNLRIAKASTEELRADLEAQRAAIIARLIGAFNEGVIPKGVDLTPGQRKLIESYGDAAVTETEASDAQADAITSRRDAEEAAEQAAEEAKSDAAEARQAQFNLRQARLGVAAAWADARGDAVAGAKIQRQIAIVQLQAARAELAAATTATERANAMAGVYAAQAGVIAANAAIQQAQADLISSQYDVSIALAEAAGNTVQAARRRLAQARAALGAAVKRSGGEATAEVNAARAAVIAAEAEARDAKLQDQLDTIDFNLEMGRITQSSAIKALQEILRTSDLTKEQRRQLLLQIKGMKDEVADSQWNFGDIKLPTPYQMRRYIEERKRDFRGQLDQAALAGRQGVQRAAGFDPGTNAAAAAGTVVNQTTINIGANASLEKVKKVVEDVVGRPAKTTTSTPRRRI